jgi:hypothetical protein
MAPGGPPGAPPGMPPRPPMAMPPGGVPPGMIPPRKRGGRVHADAKQDKALIKETLKNEGLVPPKRAHGGHVEGVTDPATKKPSLHGGGASGVGRMERAKKFGVDGEKPQVV